MRTNHHEQGGTDRHDVQQERVQTTEGLASAVGKEDALGPRWQHKWNMKQQFSEAVDKKGVKKACEVLGSAAEGTLTQEAVCGRRASQPPVTESAKTTKLHRQGTWEGHCGRL